MELRGIVRAALLMTAVVLCIMLFIRCFSGSKAVNGIVVSEQLLAASKEKHINYRKLLKNATQNDSTSIRALTLLNFGDYSTNRDHGTVIVGLIDVIGEDKFIQSLATINNNEKNDIEWYINNGLEYGKNPNFGGEELDVAFPKISLFLSFLNYSDLTPPLTTELSWKSGETTVTLSPDGTLRVRGIGAMEDYDYRLNKHYSIDHINNPPPWRVEGYTAVSTITGERLGLVPPITNVIIEEGVTYIGEIAFAQMRRLKSVAIPNSVTAIGRSAFYGCSRLTAIAIPNSVTAIGQSAFSGCAGLTSITIPSGVTHIRGRAFQGCVRLTSVTIPGSVAKFDTDVFSGCVGLTSVTIKDGVKYIGDRMFVGCTGLKSVTIPGSVSAIKHEAFMYCDALTTVTIEDGVTVIMDKAFADCENLTSVAIPNSVTRIGENAFRRCTGLTSVTIPDSVTEIGTSAFSGCTNLTSIIVMNPKPPAIGYLPFNVFMNIGAVYDGTFVMDVDSGAFYGINRKSACLYVPANAIAAYRAADMWKNFNCVEPVESFKPVEPNAADNKNGVLWPRRALGIATAALFLSAAGFVVVRRRRQSARDEAL